MRLRNFIAIISGVLISSVIIALMMVSVVLLCDDPGSLQWGRPEYFPPVLLAILIVSFLVGAFIGGYATSVLGNSWKVGLALLTGLVVATAETILGISYQVSIWVILVAGLILISLAYLGGKLGSLES